MVNTLTMKDIPLWIYEGTIRLRISRPYLLIYVIFRKYIKEMYVLNGMLCLFCCCISFTFLLIPAIHDVLIIYSVFLRYTTRRSLVPRDFVDSQIRSTYIDFILHSKPS